MSTERGNGNTGRSVTEHWRFCSASGSSTVPSTWGLSSLWAAWVVFLVQAWGRTLSVNSPHLTEKMSSYYLSHPLGFTSLWWHDRAQACSAPRTETPVSCRCSSVLPAALLLPLAVTLPPVWTGFSLHPFCRCSLHVRSVYHLERCLSSFGMKGSIWV